MENEQALVEIKGGDWFSKLLASWRLITLKVSIASCLRDMQDGSTYVVKSHIPVRYYTVRDDDAVRNVPELLPQ